MPFTIDMHLNTTAGSADSNLRPPNLRRRACDLGLPALTITEHFRVWNPVEAAALAAGTGIIIFRGIEWNTELDHIFVRGVEGYRPEIRRADDLRRYVLDCDGLMIAAHACRHALDPIATLWKAHQTGDVSLDAACRHPVFELVDAVEVLDGASTDKENDLAARVAARLGLPGVGGSDAHYAEDVGRAVTILDNPVEDERGLIAALRAGRCRAARGPAASVAIHPWGMHVSRQAAHAEKGAPVTLEVSHERSCFQTGGRADRGAAQPRDRRA